jgi:hypothetical protein
LINEQEYFEEPTEPKEIEKECLSADKVENNLKSFVISETLNSSFVSCTDIIRQ